MTTIEIIAVGALAVWLVTEVAVPGLRAIAEEFRNRRGKA